MHDKKYCNTECCNSIKREVEYILLTPSPTGWSSGGSPRLTPPPAGRSPCEGRKSGRISCIHQGVLSRYIADMSVPTSRLLGEAVASSTSIGVDVDAGGTDGAAVGLVSMAGSWTAGPASPGAGASDSRAAKLSDAGGAVELSSTATAGLRGAPTVTKMVLWACLARDSLCAS